MGGLMRRHHKHHGYKQTEAGLKREKEIAEEQAASAKKKGKALPKAKAEEKAEPKKVADGADTKSKA